MSTNKIKFIFFGTPDVASLTLEILKNAGYVPALIVTSPDKPQGRKMLMTPPPVKTWAIANSVPFIQPEAFDDKDIPGSYDLAIVVAYGKILPETLINMPSLGSINIHYSLLPKYRGASPVETAILNGDTETGVSIQKMVYKMDAGDVIAQEKTIILPDETAPELRQRLIKIGGNLLVKILPDIINNTTTNTEQNETEATYCTKIKKEDGQVDLNKDNATEIYNKYRAYAHWPRTFFFDNGKRVIITEAKLGNGQLHILKVLPEGKKEIPWSEHRTN